MKNFLTFSFLLLLSIGAFAQESKNIATLNWAAPTARENGNVLPLAEIGGYEIRYREVAPVGSNAYLYKTVILKDVSKVTYDLELPNYNSYEIQVAVFDTSGLYSNFIPLAPVIHTANASRPLLKDLTVKQKFYDPSAKCTIDVNCKVVK